MIQLFHRIRVSVGFAIVLAAYALLSGPALAQGGLRIGTEGAYPPFEYRDASGPLKGMEVEIGNALGEIMNIPCRGSP